MNLSSLFDIFVLIQQLSLVYILQFMSSQYTECGRKQYKI